MTVTDAQIKDRLAAMGQRAHNWQRLCEKYHLAPDASMEALETAIRAQGHADAVLDMNILLSDLAKRVRNHAAKVRES